MSTSCVSRHTDRHGRFHVSAESLEARRERYDRIVLLRDSGLTLEQVGQAFDPPLTKQRVQAILRAGEPRNPGRPRREPAP